MDPITLIRAIENAGYEARSYTGRGMYGRQCVGVEIDRHGSEFMLGVRLGLTLGEDAEDLSPVSDSMGLGLIVYFPKVAWPAGEKETVEEEDDDE
jgi:hypothetical protein